jgi:hypothetical protein
VLNFLNDPRTIQSDLPASRETTLGTFADNAAMFAAHENPKIASRNLQEYLNIIKK